MLLDQATTRSYNLRYRVCELHLRAEAVKVKGLTQRYCQARHLGNWEKTQPPLFPPFHAPAPLRLTRAPAQKCSRFHELSSFNGAMRTCATKLKLQLDRRRGRMLGEGPEVHAQPRDEAAVPLGAPRARGGTAESEEEEEELRVPHASRHERHLQPPAMSPSRTDGSGRSGQPSASRDAPMMVLQALARYDSADTGGDCRDARGVLAA